MNQLGNNNLFLLLGNSEMNAIALSLLAKLATVHSNLHFSLITDFEPQMFLKPNNLTIVSLSKENYQLKSEGQDNAHASLLEIKKLTNRLESSKFDFVYQFGELSWGSWIVASLGKVDVEKLRDFGPERKSSSYAFLINKFSLQDIPTNNEKKIAKSIDELYAFSCLGFQTLYVTDNPEVEKGSLFSQLQSILVVDKKKIDSIKLETLVQMWRNQSLLNSYSPVHQWDFSYYFVSDKNNKITALSDVYEEFNLIQIIIKSKGKDINFRKYDRFLVEHCVAHLKRVVFLMTENLVAGRRLFSNIQNQYFSYLVAEMVFSSITQNKKAIFDREGIILDLKKYNDYLLTLRPFWDIGSSSGGIKR